MPDLDQSEPPPTAPAKQPWSSWLKDANKLALAALIVAVVVLLVGDDLVSRVGGWIKGSPSLDERVRAAIEECRQDGFECKTSKSIVIANGAGELTAVGVDLVTKEELSSSAGSAVLVFDKSGDLRWKSPIQSFLPGYGLTALDTDVTNHLFVSFAVTNHSGIAWVIDPSATPPQTFGSVGGTGLVVDAYEEPTFAGVRRLITYREGWPANTRNPSTSRDVFEWNGTAYVHKSCEVVGPIDANGRRQVLRTLQAGSAKCLQPVGKYSVDLDGERKPTADPP
ncbi:hypothetical protein ACIBL3_01555 [Kribbella sp. NPDC050124]|uniref:hypothetical protein n=1 Tax=Kribbella sp. NPDC050124 TaxID=3364114 RepID=UPI0037AECF12